MTTTHVMFEDPARTRLLRGVDVLANAVTSTLGPRARTVLVHKGFGGPKTSNDGVITGRSKSTNPPAAASH